MHVNAAQATHVPVYLPVGGHHVNVFVQHASTV